MGKIKIGDKVRAILNYDDGIIKGLVGIVVSFKYGEYGVDFGKRFIDSDGNYAGHNLNGDITTDTGWWVLEECLEPINKSKYLRYLK